LKKIKTLLVRFENELTQYQTSAFRGAVIEKVGRENILFNHHITDDKYLYAYPLIQYKSIHKQSAIMCLGEGVENIYKLFSSKDWIINLKGDQVELKIDKLELDNINLNVWNNQYNYRITNWIALNTTNFQKFLSINALKERCDMLERILVGNIISFAKGVEWTIESEIIVNISDIVNIRDIKYKGVPLVSFDVDFDCNVFLPNYIGLGKSVSHGYGILKMIKKESHV
jgi:hypothetical protein